MSSVLRLYPTDAPLEGAVSAPLGSSSVPVTLSLLILFFQLKVCSASMDGTLTVQQEAGTKGTRVYV